MLANDLTYDAEGRVTGADPANPLSRAGGNVELVEEGVNGFCHDPRDEAGFAEKLRALIRDPQHLLEVRKASRESARRFDLESVVESYAKILEDVRQSA